MNPLSVTFIQTSLQWENKEANLRSFEEKISALKGKTQIVFLPEMFSTGFSMRPTQLAEDMGGPTVIWMKSIAAANRIILCGSIIIQENENYFNRLLWVLPNGETGVYDKRHLFSSL